VLRAPAIVTTDRNRHRVRVEVRRLRTARASAGAETVDVAIRPLNGFTVRRVEDNAEILNSLTR
jgi:hypothetical protein